MSDVNPVLLLMLALLAAAAAIAWGLGIYVAARLARRRRRPAWRWVLPAIFLGPALLGMGQLARSCRRCVISWVAAQAASIAAAIAAAALLLPAVTATSLALDMLLILALLAAALAPLAVLAWLGPSRRSAAAAGSDAPILRAVELSKAYDLGGRRLQVLRNVSLSVRRGEFVAILGASGSGKSTLLHLLGLLDAPDAGRIVLGGADSAELPAAQRDRIRCHDIGFVFQFYHLLPELNVLENTLLPAMAAARAWLWPAASRQMRQRAVEILERVGLGERLKHRPRQLSGGEQQRVAIARALVNRPSILLADEPTGNLDSTTGQQIIKVLKQLNDEAEQTIIMVTHDQALAEAAGRVLHLRDGRLH